MESPNIPKYNLKVVKGKICMMREVVMLLFVTTSPWPNLMEY